MTLIVRIDGVADLPSMLELRFPDHPLIADLVADRRGEMVVLGISSTPGVWLCRAVGVLLEGRRADGGYQLLFDAVEQLSESLHVVTEGDSHADRLERPYEIDVLGDEDVARILAKCDSYRFATTPKVLAAAEMGASVTEAGLMYGGLKPMAQNASFFHRVATVNRWTCMFTGLCLTSPDGREREGVVIGVDEPIANHDSPVSQGLFATASIGFCYRTGLLAIGDAYEILRHRALPAEMRLLLDVVNRSAMIRLPGQAADRPDLEAARRHRMRHGF